MAEKDEQREVLDSEILKARITKLEYGEKVRTENLFRYLRKISEGSILRKRAKNRPKPSICIILMAS